MQLTPMILGSVAPANAARVAIAGNYFRLVVCALPVTVRLYRKGRPFAEAANILAGYWSAPTEGFDEVEVITALAQTIVIGTIVGVGGYDRAAGDVNITGGTMLATAPLNTRDVGYNPGANYVSATNIGAGASVVVFAPGSNVNGAIVHMATAYSQAASGPFLSLLAKASAPAGATDGAVIYHVNGAAAGGVLGPRLERSRFVAAGLGLYFFSGPAETSAMRAVDYTLL